MAGRVSDTFPAAGLAADIPADPGSVPAFYSEIDTGLIRRWDGTTWDIYGYSLPEGDVGTDGYVPKWDDTVGRYTLAAETGAGGGWEHPLSLPLSTLTGWTAGTGAWSASGTGIRQSTVNAAENRLRYTGAKLASATMVAEMDVKIDTAPSTTTSRAGFVFNSPGATTAGGVLVVFRCATAGFASQVYAERDAVAAGGVLTMTTPIALGTWMTLRVLKSGNDFTAWVNGVLQGSLHQSQAIDIDSSAIALYSYNTDATFRNLDIYSPTLPV